MAKQVKVAYVGRMRAVSIPKLHIEAERGEAIDVTKEVADELVKGDWELVKAKAKTTDKKAGDF